MYTYIRREVVQVYATPMERARAQSYVVGSSGHSNGDDRDRNDIIYYHGKMETSATDAAVTIV